MIIDNVAVQLKAKCKGCGEEVVLHNELAANAASRRGILCSKCQRQGETWTPASYERYLQSNHWKIFRQQALGHYGRKCYLCGTHDAQIDLHHNDYSRLGGELMSDVIPLCHECHERHHLEY